MSESNEWLDTQTKEQLEKSPPDKLAPPVISGYSLVLLERGADSQRVDGAIRALVDDPKYVSPQCPFVVRKELSLTEALEGQFELICADSISVFVDDAVIRTAKKSYLHDLFALVRKSDEFERVKISVESVPDDESGKRFLRQFFGRVLSLPVMQIVARKKARIMQHWGRKLGATIQLDDR